MEITNHSIQSLLDTITEPRKNDILRLIDLGKKITHKEPKLWGTIIGFGNLHYKYPSGQQGDMPLFGIASRKQAISLYMSYDIEKYPHLTNLGSFKTGKGCLYIKKLSDVNIEVLSQLIKDATSDLMALPFVTNNEMV